MDIEKETQSAFEYFQTGNFQAAEELLRRILVIHPYNPGIHNNLGLILYDKGQIEEAIKHFQRAIILEPGLADAYYNLGIALKERGRFDEAITGYQKAIELNPGNADAYVNLGIVLKEKGQSDEAIASYQKALELNPKNADAYVNLSIVLKGKGQLHEAVISCQKALQHDPSNAFAYINMGNAVLYQGKPEKAEECYRHALGINSNLSLAYSNLLCSMNYNPRHDAQAIFTEHTRFAKQFAEPLSSCILPHTNSGIPDRRLKIGYVSPDFRKHSVAYFIEPVLVSHNREDFEVFCYANVLAQDEVTERIQASVDHWRIIAGLSDEGAAELITRDGIDILVDLAGHTANNQILLFARKPAPVQASWIGYPATTGLLTIDYKIVDGYTDPPGMTEGYYTEELVRLPESFLCYLPDKESPEVRPLPALEVGHITFGSFNNFAKVSSAVVSLWTEILKSVPESRLILKSHSFVDSETFRYAMEMFTREGVEENRIELLQYEPSVRGHLDLYGRVDIALDTHPYHGTTTTCEALWMGVPVVTLAGNCHASRVGVSLLSNIGLPELIAKTQEEYVRIAINLANNLEQLQFLRGNLREMMAHSLLTDTKSFTANLERCYREMWRKWRKSNY